MLEDLDFQVPKEWDELKDIRDIFIPERASDSEGILYMRPRGRETKFRLRFENGNETLSCAKCETPAEYVLRTHTIQDGHDGSGNGRVYTENFPYCPNCEEKPSSKGEPITKGCLVYN